MRIVKCTSDEDEFDFMELETLYVEVAKKPILECIERVEHDLCSGDYNVTDSLELEEAVSGIRDTLNNIKNSVNDLKFEKHLVWER